MKIRSLCLNYFTIKANVSLTSNPRNRWVGFTLRVIKDSIKQHNGGGNRNEPNIGNYKKPEGPHGIKNLSNVKIDVFRVEFKPNVNNK
jgi:hypothetical protein